MRILEAMSFTEGKGLKILGSMSLRSQQYAGDYDGYEIVDMNDETNEEALYKLAERFKRMIQHLQSMPNVYIGDIKAGSVEEWRVIDKDKYDAGKSRKKIDELHAKGIISKDEKSDALELLKNKPSITDELLAKSKIKFHIVRWTPSEVLAGKKTLRDGSIMTLEEAFSSPIISKMDVIGLVQNNRYTDFSVIYEFHNRGKTLNPDKVDIVKSLKENIIAYEKDGNYFKAMKRKFALAKYQGNNKEVERLTPILNSDLGRLYHIIGDIGTLETLIEDHNAPLKTIRYEIDQFKNRLANIYTLNDYLADEPHLLQEINNILKKPKGKILTPLVRVGNELETFLQRESKRVYSLKGGVVIPKKEFIKEHTRLVDVLGSINTPKARKELKDQLKELKNVKGGVKSKFEKDLLKFYTLKENYEDIAHYLNTTEGIPEDEFNRLRDGAMRILDEIKRLRRKLEGHYSGMGLSGGGFWDKITGAISGAFNKIKEIPVLGRVVDAASQPFQNLATTIDKGARAAVDLARGDIQGAKNNVVGIADSIINQESIANKLTKGTPLEGISKDLTKFAESRVNVPGLGISVAEAKEKANTLMNSLGKGRCDGGKKTDAELLKSTNIGELKQTLADFKREREFLMVSLQELEEEIAEAIEDRDAEMILDLELQRKELEKEINDNQQFIGRITARLREFVYTESESDIRPLPKEYRPWIKKRDQLFRELDEIEQRISRVVKGEVAMSRVDFDNLRRDKAKKEDELRQHFLVRDLRKQLKRHRTGSYKGRGLSDDFLSQALLRRPDLKAKIDDTMNWGFNRDMFNSLVKKYESPDFESRWNKIVKPASYPYKTYADFLNAVVESSVERSLVDKQQQARIDRTTEVLKHNNEIYAQYYREHPDQEPIVCNVNAKYDLVKERDVPRGECDRRHAMRMERFQQDPIFTPIMKGIMTFGDFISEVGQKLGAVPYPLALAWQTVRGITDPNNMYHSEGLAKVLDVAKTLINAGGVEGKVIETVLKGATGAGKSRRRRRKLKGGTRDSILTELLSVLEANRPILIADLENLFNDASVGDRAELHNFAESVANINDADFSFLVDSLRDLHSRENERQFYIRELLRTINTPRSSPVELTM